MDSEKAFFRPIYIKDEKFPHWGRRLWKHSGEMKKKRPRRGGAGGCGSTPGRWKKTPPQGRASGCGRPGEMEKTPPQGRARLWKLLGSEEKKPPQVAGGRGSSPGGWKKHPHRGPTAVEALQGDGKKHPHRGPAAVEAPRWGGRSELIQSHARRGVNLDTLTNHSREDRTQNLRGTLQERHGASGRRWKPENE